MAGRNADIISGLESEGKDIDSDDELTIAFGSDPYAQLGPSPPPRRSSGRPKKEDDGEGSQEGDLIDITCDLFGEPSEDPDDDAPPPTLWWDDIGMVVSR